MSVKEEITLVQTTRSTDPPPPVLFPEEKGREGTLLHGH